MVYNQVHKHWLGGDPRSCHRMDQTLMLVSKQIWLSFQKSESVENVYLFCDKILKLFKTHMFSLTKQHRVPVETHPLFICMTSLLQYFGMTIWTFPAKSEREKD